MTRNSVENSTESHKPVEIGDLRLLMVWGVGEHLEVQNGPAGR